MKAIMRPTYDYKCSVCACETTGTDPTAPRGWLRVQIVVETSGKDLDLPPKTSTCKFICASCKTHSPEYKEILLLKSIMRTH